MDFTDEQAITLAHILISRMEHGHIFELGPDKRFRCLRCGGFIAIGEHAVTTGSFLTLNGRCTHVITRENND